ncbi:tropinone reductase homolog At2g29170-like [Zingiber officinale]|uniref:Uncharacterized protein n=1 Tax=Zingiber officinale TaxID=94328 RepID=A0A8J5FWB8_ZINOF|nr:tropinone reductase homolog At2g29170-like [Zingiber officinale]KAG6491976.1 hypothetical protein ZIOFF_046922 [Zingiber officinale]
MREWQAKGFRVTGSTCDVSSPGGPREVHGGSELVVWWKTRYPCELAISIKSQMHAIAHLIEWLLFDQVNNAGTGFVKPMALITPEEYKFIMSTNVDSTFHMSQLAYPLLKDSGGGAVVDNSSLAGILGIDNFSIYGTTNGDNHD